MHSVAEADGTFLKRDLLSLQDIINVRASIRASHQFCIVCRSVEIQGCLKPRLKPILSSSSSFKDEIWKL